MPGAYKNAEYRIAFDAKSATDSPVDLTLGLVNAVLTAFIFTGVLWSVGGGLTIALGRIVLVVPGYLVIGAVIYALVFTGLMLAIGRNLPGIIQLQSQSEAEFLAAANQIRESGQHAATDGETEQQHAVWEALAQVLLRWRQLLWQLMGTTFVSQTDLLFAPVFGWALCVPKYLAGTMTLGELTQASAAFVTSRSRSIGWSTIISACRIGAPPPTASPCCSWRSMGSSSRNRQSRASLDQLPKPAK